MTQLEMFTYCPNTLLCYKLWDEAHLPEYGSEWAACFDLKASLRDGDKVKVYAENNNSSKREIKNSTITMYSGERMLVPTGIIFDLHESQSLRIHPRSGLSLKNGVVIANCEGVVDADYVQQTYVMLYNISSQPFEITDGMRIAQGEIVKNKHMIIDTVTIAPTEKTNRSGGFGSTGTK